MDPRRIKTRSMTRIAVISLVAAAVMLSGACTRESSSMPGGAAVTQDVRDPLALVTLYCSGCHAPPRPQARGPGQWRAVVTRMQEHRVHAGRAPIPAEKIDSIITYLQGGRGSE